MANRTYYVICDDNCRFESMTKEQILAAITQAVSTGEIKDVDTGFVTKIKEANSGAGLSFWVGTTAEYNAIQTKTENCFYILSDDTIEQDIQQQIAKLDLSVANLTATVRDTPKLAAEPNKLLLENPTTSMATATGAHKYRLFAAKCELSKNPTGVYQTRQVLLYLTNEPTETVPGAATATFDMDSDEAYGKLILQVLPDKLSISAAASVSTVSVSVLSVTGVM